MVEHGRTTGGGGRVAPVHLPRRARRKSIVDLAVGVTLVLAGMALFWIIDALDRFTQD